MALSVRDGEGLFPGSFWQQTVVDEEGRHAGWFLLVCVVPRNRQLLLAEFGESIQYDHRKAWRREDHRTSNHAGWGPYVLLWHFTSAWELVSKTDYLRYMHYQVRQPNQRFLDYLRGPLRPKPWKAPQVYPMPYPDSDDDNGSTFTTPLPCVEERAITFSDLST
jgi:hypothetical protein